MSMFVSSENIKVYPTAFRGSDSRDTDSCLMSEKNITGLKKISSIDGFNNYVNFIENGGDYKVDLTLSGYRFTFNFSVVNANPGGVGHTSGNDVLYAGIKIVNDELYPNTETTNRVLDEAGKFKGLTITYSESDFDDNFIYIKIGYWDSSNTTWKPFTTNNNLKLLSSEISNDNLGTKNIREQFDTNVANITTENVTTINLNTNTGNIYKNNQSVIIPPYTNTGQHSTVNKVLSVNASGALYWRETYDGTVEITRS